MAFAFVAAVLLSQIGTNNAQTTPWRVDPCPSGGCSGCTSLGFTDNASAASIKFSDYYGECCDQGAETPCVSWRWLQGGSCGTGKIFDLTKKLTAKGTDPVAACCKTLTTTCADVSCNVGGSEAEFQKAKAGVALTTACTSDSDCINQCCEKDTTICAGAPFSCENGKKKTMFVTETCSNGVDTYSYSANAKTAVNSETEFRASCCEDRPLCTASSCPAYMERSTGTNYDDDSDMVSSCCQDKATACKSLCSGGSTWNRNEDSCGVPAMEVCESTICTDADTKLNMYAVFATGDTDAAKKTACCVSDAPKTCAAQKAEAEAQAAAKAGAGSTSAAQFNRASTTVSVLMALMTVSCL